MAGARLPPKIRKMLPVIFRWEPSQFGSPLLLDFRSNLRPWKSLLLYQLMFLAAQGSWFPRNKLTP
jgi:hypothetical protein